MWHREPAAAPLTVALGVGGVTVGAVAAGAAVALPLDGLVGVLAVVHPVINNRTGAIANVIATGVGRFLRTGIIIPRSTWDRLLATTSPRL